MRASDLQDVINSIPPERKVKVKIDTTKPFDIGVTLGEAYQDEGGTLILVFLGSSSGFNETQVN